MKTNKLESWVEFIIDQQFHKQPVSAFLDFYHQSKKSKYTLFLDKHITLNDKFITIDTLLTISDSLKIKVSIEEERDFIDQDLPLEVVYEDDFILVVNKQCGMIVHPDTKEGLNTLANAVSHYYKSTNQNHTIRPIHRLDMDTTGLVMFSKCSFFQPYLDDALNRKEIHRQYYALVSGIFIKYEKLTISEPIGKDRHNNNKFRVSPSGKEAITHVECVKCYQKQHYSLVRCTLETGRTHQIRVHLAYINHPILSDSIYGRPSRWIQRCALHAYKLTFVHPLTQQNKTIEIELPQDMIIKK